MRRFLCILLLGFVSQLSAQVVCYVEQPALVEGPKQFTYAEWTATPDLVNPANIVHDTLAFALGADSLVCNAVTNSSQVNGKIAVIYRGTCEFGLKALNCQNAGAVAVIIINNVPGAPVAMGEGANGSTVNIPVVMITADEGAALRSAILSGTCVAFIGNKTGYFENDLGFFAENIIAPKNTANPRLVNQNSSEFSNYVGAWVHNYGSNTQTNVTLNAKITLNGTPVYNQTSTPAGPLVTGDSMWVQLPNFSPATLNNGLYKFSYSVGSDSIAQDDFVGDNMLRADFTVSDTLFAYGSIDTVTLATKIDASYRPADNTGEFEVCLHMRDSLASRLAVTGMYFSASMTTGLDITTELVDFTVYEWLNDFEDLNDANLDFSNVSPAAVGSYEYTANDQNMLKFAALPSPYILSNNVRYLFCVKTTSPDLYFGFTTDLDYNEAVNYYLQPNNPINDDGTWYALGFGTDVVPSLGLRVVDATTAGVEENAITSKPAYPNPAMNIVYIPMQNITGDLEISIMDLSGKVIKTEVRNVQNQGSLPVNLDGVSNGQYIVRVTSSDAAQSFKIIVNH